jgi:hypothetical protein
MNLQRKGRCDAVSSAHVMAHAEHEWYEGREMTFLSLLSFRGTGLKLAQNDGVDLPMSPVDGQSRRRTIFLKSFCCSLDAVI